MWHEIFNQLKSDLIKINLVVYLHVAELFIKTSHWLKNLKRRNSFFIVSSDALYRLWIFQQIEWKSELYHSMARANVNNSVWLVTNTPTASKYIPRRTRISINWNPPFRPHFINFSKTVFYEVNLLPQCSHLEVLLLSKFGSERGGFQLEQILGLLGMYFDAVVEEVKTY